jgi:primosomal protein N'
MENKYLIAKLLGEIYQIKKKIEPSMCHDITDGEIFGLQNMIEPVVDKKINEINSNVISNKEIEEIENILEKWDSEIDNSKTAYWLLEGRTGRDKSKIYIILKYLYLEGKYHDVIEEIINNGPIEFKNEFRTLFRKEK